MLLQVIPYWLKSLLNQWGYFLRRSLLKRSRKWPACSLQFRTGQSGWQACKGLKDWLLEVRWNEFVLYMWNVCCVHFVSRCSLRCWLVRNWNMFMHCNEHIKVMCWFGNVNYSQSYGKLEFWPSLAFFPLLSLFSNAVRVLHLQLLVGWFPIYTKLGYTFWKGLLFEGYGDL